MQREPPAVTFILLLALQAAPAPPPKPPECKTSATAGEVVVCARAEQERFRLRPLPNRFEKPKTGPGMELDLGGGAKANLYSTGEVSPDGKPDKRIMAKVRIPF